MINITAKLSTQPLCLNMPAEATTLSLPTETSSLKITTFQPALVRERHVVRLGYQTDEDTWDLRFYRPDLTSPRSTATTADYSWLTEELARRQTSPTDTSEHSLVHDRVVDFIVINWELLNRTFRLGNRELTTPSCFTEVNLELSPWHGIRYGGRPDIVGIDSQGTVHLMEVKSKPQGSRVGNKQIRSTGKVFEENFRDQYGNPFPTALHNIMYQQLPEGGVHLRIGQVFQDAEADSVILAA